MATIPPTAHEVEPLEPPLIEHPGRRMTEDEFVAWCLGFEKVRAEWVDGEVILRLPANPRHVDLVDFLAAVLRVFAEHHDLGRVATREYICRFRSGTRLVRLLPDVLFVARDRRHLLRRTYLDGPPDLAVEVVSRDSVSRDYREKYQDYQAAGVREYWIVDPLSENVEASRLDPQAGQFRRIAEAEGRVTSEVLPGFFLRPEWLWRDALPRVTDVLRELGV
jgi:Uma2 family endonuclease